MEKKKPSPWGEGSKGVGCPECRHYYMEWRVGSPTSVSASPRQLLPGEELFGLRIRGYTRPLRGLGMTARDKANPHLARLCRATRPRKQGQVTPPPYPPPMEGAFGLRTSGSFDFALRAPLRMTRLPCARVRNEDEGRAEEIAKKTCKIA